ncbi:MAG: TetR/AcrR family transcriptional regulator [Dehalococcoidales bacterium]|nr:TetR/AcrR family transcriptional regulator [Dehalococcoidales bacterium]
MAGSENKKVVRNKERIIRAALELFRVHGIKKVAISDVAQKAGISSATIYNHFGSKENMVYATVRYFLTSKLTDFRKVMEGNLTFLEKLEQILMYKEEIFGQYQGELLQEIISDNSEIQQFIDSVYLVEATQILNEFYEEGKKQGYINPELSIKTIMLYSEIIRKGIAGRSILSEDPERNRNLMHDLMPLFIYGIVGNPGKQYL